MKLIMVIQHLILLIIIKHLIINILSAGLQSSGWSSSNQLPRKVDLRSALDKHGRDDDRLFPRLKSGAITVGLCAALSREHLLVELLRRKKQACCSSHGLEAGSSTVAAISMFWAVSQWHSLWVISHHSGGEKTLPASCYPTRKPRDVDWIMLMIYLQMKRSKLWYAVLLNCSFAFAFSFASMMVCASTGNHSLLQVWHTFMLPLTTYCSNSKW